MVGGAKLLMRGVRHPSLDLRACVGYLAKPLRLHVRRLVVDWERTNIALPGRQNLQPFLIVEAAGTVGVARRAQVARRIELDFFAQFFPGHWPASPAKNNIPCPPSVPRPTRIKTKREPPP